MKFRISAITVVSGIFFAALPAFAAEATFERNLTLTGRPDLTVSTGSGTIHLTTGPAGQIHITGHVHSTWGGSEDRVREIAANPPIQQTGNIVRIGRTGRLDNISIDYEIQAPADSYLEATTGSGQINDEGVGTNPHLSTGSGDVRANALHGNTTLSTGSGSITAEFASPGDVKAESGSGSIELRSVQGGLYVRTGSGGVNVGGMPTASWDIQTGSGSVNFWSSNTSFKLDAACGSGGIQVDRPITAKTEDSRHHVSGTIAAGGPDVRIRTGSGGIHIH